MTNRVLMKIFDSFFRFSVALGIGGFVLNTLAKGRRLLPSPGKRSEGGY